MPIARSPSPGENGIFPKPRAVPTKTKRKVFLPQKQRRRTEIEKCKRRGRCCSWRWLRECLGSSWLQIPMRRLKCTCVGVGVGVGVRARACVPWLLACRPPACALTHCPLRTVRWVRQRWRRLAASTPCTLASWYSSLCDACACAACAAADVGVSRELRAGVAASTSSAAMCARHEAASQTPAAGAGSLLLRKGSHL